MIDQILLLGFAVLVAWTIEAATGFGSIVIALSLAALFLPIEQVVPILVVLNITMTIPMVLKLKSHIHLPLLLTHILPLMVIGLITGQLLMPYIEGKWLPIGFAILVLWFAIRSLGQLLGKLKASKPSHWKSVTLTYLAGITHGLYASGGPLLVYSLSTQSLSKAQFRSTLLAVWASLNLVMTIWFVGNGRIAETEWWSIFALLPAVWVGAKSGSWLHDKIDEFMFKKIVAVLLIVTAVILLAKQI